MLTNGEIADQILLDKELIVIEEAFIPTLKQMLTSTDKGDHKLAEAIIAKRDTSNTTSEENVKKLRLSICVEQIAIRTLDTKVSNNIWVLQMSGETLTLPNGKRHWKAKNHASSALSNAMFSLVHTHECLLAGFNSRQDLKEWLLKSKTIEIVNINPK